MGGHAYKFISEQILKESLSEVITGNNYISSSELHRVLGRKLRIPQNKQMSIIRELTMLGVLSISSIPNCVIRRKSSGEIFYLVKKLEEVEE